MGCTRSRVGVVVLNHGGAADTLGCLDSLQHVTPAPTVVVVDNGSADGSAEVLAAALVDRPGLDATLVVNDHNVGFGRGCNLGIGALRPRDVDYVWLLNNDAAVEAGTLAAMLAVAESDSRVGAVGSVIHDMDEPGRVTTWGGGSASTWTGFTRDARSPTDPLDYLTGASLLLRTRAIDDVGGFDPRFFFTWEDVDLARRLTRRGWTLAVADRSRVWHRSGGTLAPGSPTRMRYHAQGLVVFMRAHSPAPALTALPMLSWYALTAVRRRRVAVLTEAVRGWWSGWSL